MGCTQMEATLTPTEPVEDSFTPVAAEPCPEGSHEMVFQFGEGGRKCGGGTYETYRCALCGETGHA